MKRLKREERFEANYKKFVRARHTNSGQPQPQPRDKKKPPRPVSDEELNRIYKQIVKHDWFWPAFTYECGLYDRELITIKALARVLHRILDTRPDLKLRQYEGGDEFRTVLGDETIRYFVGVHGAWRMQWPE